MIPFGENVYSSTASNIIKNNTSSSISRFRNGCLDVTKSSTSNTKPSTVALHNSHTGHTEYNMTNLQIIKQI